MAVDSSVAGPARGAPDATAAMARIQELTERLDALAEPRVRELADELTAAIVQLYGSGLARIVELAGEAGEPTELREALGADELVGSLLLIHDLHPVPVEERVLQALERVRPYMESHGGDVELLGVEDHVARLRLQGSCTSCRASSSTLELAVRQALEELAPDLEGMDVEGFGQQEPELAGFPGVALPMAGDGEGPSWHDVGGVAALEPGERIAVSAAGADLIVANVDGTLLAYRDRCAGCGAALDGGELVGSTLTCPACSRGFMATGAGRCVDDDALQLEPVPLLREGDRVRVALAG